MDADREPAAPDDEDFVARWPWVVLFLGLAAVALLVVVFLSSSSAAGGCGG